MRASRFTIRRLFTLTLLALGLAAGTTWPRSAQATYTLTLQQVGTSVVARGGGTLNLADLSVVPGTMTLLGINSANAYVAVGANGAFNAYFGDIDGPNNFGPGDAIFATSSTGDLAAIRGLSGELRLPKSYASGSVLSGTATFDNQSFASLGFVPGTYTWSWGSGVNADTFIVASIAPEPSTWTLLGLGVVSVSVAVLRRRSRAA